jgi:hypothetical protein
VLGRIVYACDECANRRCDWCGKARKPSAYAGDDVAGLIDICQWCRGTETRRNGTAKKPLQGEKKGGTVFEL